LANRDSASIVSVTVSSLSFFDDCRLAGTAACRQHPACGTVNQLMRTYD
jgi:hypothetical protein